ncbi:MAG TPA: Ig-like domain-containing protein, partial [candidate division Zixibacteria bacterium]
MKIKFWIRLFTSGLILLLISCAKRDFPPGGPADLTSPQVLEVFPPDNSLNIDPSTKITLTFSERMDKEKTEKSIFITPVPETPFKFKWKKNKLVLEPSQPLQKDRTYVINLGANAQDLHNNKLEKSYSFAFSTGEKLDDGFISGKTNFQSKKEKGVSIWAYPLIKDKEPDPKKDKPEYATISDQNGEYSLSYLAKSLYRLFAVKDLNNDLLWDPDKEPLGVATKDVNLSQDSLSFFGIDFTLIQRDTTLPTLLNCQSMDKRTVRLEFDEPLSFRAGQSLYEKDNYKLFSDTLLEQSLKVEQVYTKGEDYQKVYLVKDEMTKRKYTVYVQNLFDLSGNPVNSQYNNCFFEGTESEDK